MTNDEERGYLAAAALGALHFAPRDPEPATQPGRYAAISARLSTLPYAFFGRAATKT